MLQKEVAIEGAGDDARRVDVLGVGISVTSPRDALERLAGWIDRRESRYVCVTGVHGVIESQSDPDLLRIHNESGLTIPDGVPMVWSGWYAGARDLRLMRGTDFTLTVCEEAAARGWRVFFYGGADGVANRLADHLADRYPGLEIAGTYTPPFRALTESEAEEVAARINDAAADIVFVGLSTPKQERWMAEFSDRLRTGALIGVGAAFDVHSGSKPEAPRWLRPIGMEWLYRLVREPRRLWRRYLFSVPRFALGILRRRPRLRGESFEQR